MPTFEEITQKVEAIKLPEMKSFAGPVDTTAMRANPMMNSLAQHFERHNREGQRILDESNQGLAKDFQMMQVFLNVSEKARAYKTGLHYDRGSIKATMQASLDNFKATLEKLPGAQEKQEAINGRKKEIEDRIIKLDDLIARGSDTLQKRIKIYEDLKRKWEKTPPEADITAVKEAYKQIHIVYNNIKDAHNLREGFQSVLPELDKLSPAARQTVTPSTQPIPVVIGTENAGKLPEIRMGTPTEQLRTPGVENLNKLATDLREKGYEVIPNQDKTMLQIYLTPGQTMEQLKKDCAPIKVIPEAEYKQTMERRQSQESQQQRRPSNA